MNYELLAPYDNIRPFEPEELPAVYDRLLADPQFKAVISYVFPGVPFETLAAKMKACATNLDFQKAFCYGFLQQLLAKASLGCDIDVSAIDTTGRYTFVSNHRDIVLDASFLNLALLYNHYRTTEVAIGSNLLIYKWIEDLVRINKSVIVKRDLNIRQALGAAEQLSGYIHFAITQKHESVWIAQRQGRAKDSSDTTQESLIKMLAIKGGKSTIDNLLELNIMPVAISYELDPNDYLKAREFLLKAKDPDFKKTKRDDLFSMETGLLQNKGRVHFTFTDCINPEMEKLRGLDKQETLLGVSNIIDRQIHSNYRIYPCNYIAFGERFNDSRFNDRYTKEDHDKFEAYLSGQLAKVQKEVDFTLTDEDYAFMREKILVMYSNPLVNKLKALGEL